MQIIKYSKVVFSLLLSVVLFLSASQSVRPDVIHESETIGSTTAQAAMSYDRQSNLLGASYILWNPTPRYNIQPGPPLRLVAEADLLASYCAASGGCSDLIPESLNIDSVEVGDICNTGTGCDGYADYTSLSTTMEIGKNYQITVTNGDPYDDDDQCGIWVDWNQDQDFYDAGETISVTGGPVVFTATITPPDAAGLGPERMRIRIRWTGTLDPCGDTDWGEVEDYTIIVAGIEGATIEGTKFHDLNGNGIRQANEPGLGGRTIYLDINENETFDEGEPNAVTEPNGFYRFADLPAGCYTVAEVPQPGWSQTLPGWMGGRMFGSERLDDVDATRIVEIDPNNGSVINSFTVPQHLLFLGGSDMATGPTSIFFINDLITGPDEITLAIWELEAQTGTVIDYDEVVPDKLSVDLGAAYLNGKLYIALGEPPFPVTQIDIMEWDPVLDEVTGTVTVSEQMGDGMAADPEAGELLITYWFDKVARIDPSTGDILGTVDHNLVPCVLLAYVDGKIIRTKWCADFVSYVIDPNSGEILDSFLITGVDNLDGMGGDGHWTQRYKVTLESQQVLNLDFGNVHSNSAKIRGTKWNDLDGDGHRDEAEPPVQGCGIYLDLNTNGKADIDEPFTITDSNGVYEFTSLAVANYVVAEAQQCSWSRTGPYPVSKELIDVAEPRDLVFDTQRNILYIGTAAGTVERYDLAAKQMLTPYSVGTLLYGMDISVDSSVLYVTEGQTPGAQGVLHKVYLDTGTVTDITYPLEAGEAGGWDIHIASNNKGLLSVQDDGSESVKLRQLDVPTDTITIRADIPGSPSGNINENTRIIRSTDRSVLWVVGTHSDGWIFTYDAGSDSFQQVFKRNRYLRDIPFSLNRDATLVAYQSSYASLRLWTNQFEPVTAFKDSKGGVVFDGLHNRLYMAQSDSDRILAIETKTSSTLFHIPVGDDLAQYSIFARGEMAVSDDGRFIALTSPLRVYLFHLQHQVRTTPGRTFENIDFGNIRNIAGDLDGNQQVNFKDLKILAERWLTDNTCGDIFPLEADGIINLADFSALASNWRRSQSLLMEFDEDFETGDFSKYPWTFEGPAPWKVVSSRAFQGTYCAQSDEWLPRYTTTAMKVQLQVDQGRIKFFYKTGTRDGSLRFYIDDVRCGSWDENDSDDWIFYSYPVSPGTHTFKWEYETGVFGDMCSWVDAIIFPPIIE